MSNLGDPTEDRNPENESDSDRLRGILAPGAMTVELVSAIAGDRTLTPTEQSLIRDLKEGRRELFYSDLLYAVTHQFFPPATAEKLWEEILQHKRRLSKVLERNVQIIVATLDYLTNIKSGMRFPTLVSEGHIASIVNRSMRDGLTGLFNHVSCHEIITLGLNSFSRQGSVFSLMIADLDDFKDVNDQSGHQEGDRVLKAVAAGMEAAARDSDICCRYGGEEFAVILPATALPGAMEIAERIRVRTMKIVSCGRPMTLSAGVTSCDETTTTAHALVEKADRALLRAKKSGKNRVVSL